MANVAYISDHSPIFITLTSSQLNIKIYFKFINIQVERKDFLQIVEHNWQCTKDHNIEKNLWMKLKALYADLKTLSNMEFKATTQRIEQPRIDLIIIKENMLHCPSDTLQSQEKITLQTLEKQSSVKKSLKKQKSRAQWIKLGDSNIKYFSPVVKDS